MAFQKTATVTVLGAVDGAHRDQGLRRTAKTAKVASVYAETWGALDLQAALDLVADRYALSKNPADYIFVAVRACSTDAPNENGDAFAKEELLRFDHAAAKHVYKTFELKPNHINHRTDNPRAARGFILDASYNQLDPNDEFVEALIAVDRTKDRVYAAGILDGSINKFSMGCSCAQTRCNTCGNIARTASEFCTHIRNAKMRVFVPDGRGGWKVSQMSAREAASHQDARIAFEWCEFVTYDELSGVDQPADVKAETQEVLTRSAAVHQERPSQDELERESSALRVRSQMRGRPKAASKKAAEQPQTQPPVAEPQAAAPPPPVAPPVAEPQAAAEERVPPAPAPDAPAAELPKGAQQVAPAPQPQPAPVESDIEEYQEEEEEEAGDQMSASEMGIEMVPVTGMLTVDQVRKRSPSIAAHLVRSGKKAISAKDYQGLRAQFFRHRDAHQDISVGPTPAGNLCVYRAGRAIYAVPAKAKKADRKGACLTILEAVAMHGLDQAMVHYRAIPIQAGVDADPQTDMADGADEPPKSVTEAPETDGKEKHAHRVRVADRAKVSAKDLVGKRPNDFVRISKRWRGQPTIEARRAGLSHVVKTLSPHADPVTTRADLLNGWIATLHLADGPYHLLTAPSHVQDEESWLRRAAPTDSQSGGETDGKEKPGGPPSATPEGGSTNADTKLPSPPESVTGSPDSDAAENPDKPAGSTQDKAVDDMKTAWLRARREMTRAVRAKKWAPPAQVRKAEAPPGWEKTVEEMKGHPEIGNPFALAWFMHNRGDQPAKQSRRVPTPVQVTAADRRAGEERVQREVQTKIERVYQARFEKKKAELEKQAEAIAAKKIKAFTERFKRSLRLAGRRMALNLEDHPIKIAMYDMLATPLDLGGGEQYPGMEGDDRLMGLLIEGGVDESATQTFAEQLVGRALELSAMTDEALQSLETDAAKLRPATLTVEAAGTSRTAGRSALRERAREGSIPINPSGEEAQPQTTGNGRFDRTALRRAFSMGHVPRHLDEFAAER